MEPVDFDASLKCEEDKVYDICDIPIKLYIGNECNFITTTEREHLKITKNVFCKECSLKSPFGCLIKEHIMIHNRVGCRHTTKNCNIKTSQIPFLALQLKTLNSNENYTYKQCDFKTKLGQSLMKHVKIHISSECKCKEYDYKIFCNENPKMHMKILIGNKYKCNECDYKMVRKNSVMVYVKIYTGESYPKQTKESHVGLEKLCDTIVKDLILLQTLGARIEYWDLIVKYLLVTKYDE
ncbi:hypothetical protein FQA39_LY04507 [Lamprigera yunnana]|nr:hypothetical protein FQA39_LY04507 [Lamprigera yunnana]